MDTPSSSVPVVEKGALREAGAYWPDETEVTAELRWPKSVEVFGRMRREDAQVKSVLSAVKMPVRRTPRRIDGTGCRPEVVQLVAEDLGLPIVGAETVAPRRTKDRFSFSEHLRLALTELDYGSSVFEQVYRADEQSRRYHLRKLGWRPPRTIAVWDEAADGGLVAIEQNLINSLAKGGTIRIPVDRLVVYCNEREDSWVGSSLLRPAYKYWLLKDQLLRIQQQIMIRNGMGVPVYTAPKLPEGITMSADELKVWEQAQIDAGLEIAKSLRAGETAGASLANGATLAMKGVEGKTPDPLPAIKYYDEQIARAVLAHFLNLGGDKSTGSYALGDTFADFFTQSLQALSDQFDDVFNAHVIEDLVDVNWGPDEPAPRLVSDRIGAALTAEALKSLVDAGVIRPDDKLENFTRSRYGLPVRDPDTTRATTAEPTGEPDAA